MAALGNQRITGDKTVTFMYQGTVGRGWIKDSFTQDNGKTWRHVIHIEEHESTRVVAHIDDPRDILSIQ